ncbi:unnamed protein product [Sphagnum balticum]
MNSELLRRTEANDVNYPSLVRDARKTGHVCCSSEACLLAAFSFLCVIAQLRLDALLVFGKRGINMCCSEFT